MLTVSSSDNQQASRSFPLEQVSLLVAHSIIVKRTLSSRCVMIIPSAAKESQHKICCDASVVSSSLHPNCNGHIHCCRRPMLSQAPESAATNSASPLLSAIVDSFLLDAVIGYEVYLAGHVAVPLTLSRSASPAQSESPYVNTEPTGDLFKASRSSVVGRTVMIPGFPRRYRKISMIFLMSVSLARPRLW